jgi:hypothetical protein
MLKDPDLNKKVEIAAEKTTPLTSNVDNTEGMGGIKKSRTIKKEDTKNSELAQVVGVILGSPEFQRK